MKKEALRQWLKRRAAESHVTMGQMIFTTAGFILAGASILDLRIIFIVTLVVACTLLWVFRADLRD